MRLDISNNRILLAQNISYTIFRKRRITGYKLL